jgi:hypothetical protein
MDQYDTYRRIHKPAAALKGSSSTVSLRHAEIKYSQMPHMELGLMDYPSSGYKQVIAESPEMATNYP